MWLRIVGCCKYARRVHSYIGRKYRLITAAQARPVMNNGMAAEKRYMNVRTQLSSRFHRHMFSMDSLTYGRPYTVAFGPDLPPLTVMVFRVGARVL